MRIPALLAAAIILGQATLASAAGLEAAKPGDILTLAGKQVAVTDIHITPVVKNEYSAVFHFDCFGKPELAELRSTYALDKVIAPGKTEFEKQQLLCEWVNKAITFGAPKTNPRGAMAILKAAAAGEQLNCGYFAATLEQAAMSLGWIARDIGLKGAMSDGNGTEHSVCEIWSNQFQKWIMFDPTTRMVVEKDGLPLSAVEIRQEWFYQGGGKNLTFVLGAGDRQQKFTRDQLPIQLGNFKDFGPLTVNADSIGKFLIIMYVPPAKTGGPDYEHMFIVKDKLADGVQTHTRKNPADPAKEAYWPMNQAALTFTPLTEGTIKVAAETTTPDFANYRSRVDGKPWSDNLLETWTLHPGTNSLEVVAVNKFGVEGAPSKVVLEVK